MAQVTRKYLHYVEQIRLHNLELAAEYLLMAAMLIEIKSRMLLPVKRADDDEAGDPRAELVRRLLEYEQMKLAARQIDALPQLGRDFAAPRRSTSSRAWCRAGPRSMRPTCRRAWSDVIKRAKLVAASHASAARSCRCATHMTGILRRLQSARFVEFSDLFDARPRRAGRGGELRCDARAGQGNPDRDHPGRALRAHLCAASLLTELRAGILAAQRVASQPEGHHENHFFHR